MVKPKKIFKYMPINQYSKENLKKNQLYFNIPANFNDPYDQDIPFIEKPLTKDSILQNKLKFPELNELTLNQYKNFIISEVKPSFVTAIKEITNSHGVTCFSESNNNILMWSHYADSHKGLCLEFDAVHTFFERLIKVKYEQFLPKIDLLRYFDGELSIEEIKQYYCTKFIDWEYEKEFRLMMSKGNQAYKYPRECLIGVYLGLNTNADDEKDIRVLCPDVHFYKAAKSESEFKVVFNDYNFD